jgi:hypothetical protein
MRQLSDKCRTLHNTCKCRPDGHTSLKSTHSGIFSRRGRSAKINLLVWALLDQELPRDKQGRNDAFQRGRPAREPVYSATIDRTAFQALDRLSARRGDDGGQGCQKLTEWIGEIGGDTMNASFWQTGRDCSWPGRPRYGAWCAAVGRAGSCRCWATRRPRGRWASGRAAARRGRCPVRRGGFRR